MPLVTTTEMFKRAYGNYAIGAFNVNNMEIVQGITEAAMEEHAPVILQVSAGARKYAKHVYLMKLIEAAVEITCAKSQTDLPSGPPVSFIPIRLLVIIFLHVFSSKSIHLFFITHVTVYDVKLGPLSP